MSAAGIITMSSRYTVAQTIDRLTTNLQEKGVQVFARIDHSGEAKKVGMEMPPTLLLIFGNPRGGTLLMLAEPLVAIDLPLKALAWQDKEGKVWLSYNDPEYLSRRFGLSAEKIDPIRGLGALITKAAE